MESRSLLIMGSCALFILPFAFYLLRKRKLTETKSSAERSPKIKAATPNNVVHFQRDNLTIDDAICLRRVITDSNEKHQTTALLVLHEASAFSSNYEVIQSSGCLKAMLDILRCNKNEPDNKQRILVSLQTITNLACHQESLAIIGNHLDDIFRLAKVKKYNEESNAALQLLCNIALTTRGCLLLCNRINTLYYILETSDVYMLRQVLSVLLNLSCDNIGSLTILNSKVPHELLDSLNRCLSSSVQPLVILQTVTFIKHLYTAITLHKAGLVHHGKDDHESMYNFLSRIRPTLRIRLALTRSEITASEVTYELIKRIDELVQLIDDVHFD